MFLQSVKVQQSSENHFLFRRPFFTIFSSTFYIMQLSSFLRVTDFAKINIKECKFTKHNKRHILPETKSFNAPQKLSPHE